MSGREKMRKLSAFIRMLGKRNIHKFNPDDFISRLRLQKYMYLAKFFDIDLGYKYNLYLRGPYSPTLAEDYYNLTEMDKVADIISISNVGEFADFVRGKDHKWLEIASTILFIWENNMRKEWSSEDKFKTFIITRTSDIKSHAGRPFVERVFRELEKAGLLKLVSNS
jgi:uncharacterized protein YwgA